MSLKGTSAIKSYSTNEPMRIQWKYAEFAFESESKWTTKFTEIFRNNIIRGTAICKGSTIFQK